MLLTGRMHGASTDREIERDLRAELEMDIGVARHQPVGIAVERGVVWLTGSVDSYAEKWAVVRAAGRVLGVRDVRDHLDVRPPGETQPEDEHVERTARCVLEWDARVPNEVSAEVTDGALRLYGTVSRLVERDAAEEAVRNLVGVRHVANEIRVAPTLRPPRAADLAQSVGDALRRRFGLGNGYLSIVAADGVVTLSGVAASFAMLEDIERAVRSIPGVTRIDNRLLVA